jgi:hypothetical protein
MSNRNNWPRWPPASPGLRRRRRAQPRPAKAAPGGSQAARATARRDVFTAGTRTRQALSLEEFKAGYRVHGATGAQAARELPAMDRTRAARSSDEFANLELIKKAGTKAPMMSLRLRQERQARFKEYSLIETNEEQVRQTPSVSAGRASRPGIQRYRATGEHHDGSNVTKVWKKISPSSKPSCQRFWTRHKAIGEETDAAKRAKQVVCIARDEKRRARRRQHRATAHRAAPAPADVLLPQLHRRGRARPAARARFPGAEQAGAAGLQPRPCPSRCAWA